jgi:hypothetical protein
MRQQFWQLVVPIALRIKDQELAEGLDAEGEPLRPISAKTRKYRHSAMTPDGKGDPAAPPLMPAYQKSRVRSLLAGRAFSTHAELYWRFDPFTGRSFDVILNYQRDEGRDVFGISDDGLRTIRIQSWAAWARWKQSGAAPAEKKSAFPAYALTQGQQSRIASIIARSIEPESGQAATRAVGALETRLITRGIGAPTIAELKASATRSGMMTGEEWRKYFTQEGKIGRPPPARAEVPIAPTAPRLPGTQPVLTTGPVAPAKVKMAPEARLTELSNYTQSLGIESHVISMEEFTTRFKGAAIDKALAAYDPKTQAIWWNLESPAWANPVKHFETMRKEKFLVDPTPSGVVHHEIGHAKLHAELIRGLGLEAATARYWELARDEFKTNNDLKQRIKKVASRLAAIDKNEFVAEIYSGLVIGRRYPEEVLVLYDELGGVRP